MPAPTQGEKIDAMTNALAKLDERLDNLRTSVDDLIKERAKLEVLAERLQNAKQDMELIDGHLRDCRDLIKQSAERQQELATDQRVHAQLLDVLQKQIETWGTRVWSIVTILITAVLALATGLIIASLRKSP